MIVRLNLDVELFRARTHHLPFCCVGISGEMFFERPRIHAANFSNTKACTGHVDARDQSSINAEIVFRFEDVDIYVFVANKDVIDTQNVMLCYVTFEQLSEERQKTIESLTRVLPLNEEHDSPGLREDSVDKDTPPKLCAWVEAEDNFMPWILHTSQTLQ